MYMSDQSWSMAAGHSMTWLIILSQFAALPCLGKGLG